MTCSSEERELIHRLTHGDRQAWATFVDRYSGLVYSRIQKAALEIQAPIDSNDCEDLCADVFAALLSDNCRSLRSFRGRSKLSTWLATVTRRICLRKLTRKHIPTLRPARHDSSTRPVEPSTTASSDALECLIRSEERDGIRTAMLQLKPSDREILTLFYLDGLKYEEIGRRMGISVNTVGPKLNRAQRRLRQLLSADDPPTDHPRFR